MQRERMKVHAPGTHPASKRTESWTDQQLESRIIDPCCWVRICPPLRQSHDPDFLLHLLLIVATTTNNNPTTTLFAIKLSEARVIATAVQSEIPLAHFGD